MILFIIYESFYCKHVSIEAARCHLTSIINTTPVQYFYLLPQVLAPIDLSARVVCVCVCVCVCLPPPPCVRIYRSKN